ncbi:hypothetical protein PaG_01604 [Moesziomyces aphidis]|jgi:nucleolar protein 16|uniref:Nucleolar protein 16 n=1 Tax=Moesziomyces aphidis TaxID=84754 RepID=W3VRC9_MOEAP|nr:hypothetical protein PaG_01604 [Moesziomyces aphidis]
MANPRQRRKARSGTSLKPSLNAKQRMRKKLQRAPTVHGADILKDSYDPTLTLKQNYARLGLIPALGVRPNTGGTEKPAAAAAAGSSGESDKPRKGMARVIRDDDGNIVDIVEAPADQETTPWGKPLDNSVEERTDVHTFIPAASKTTTSVVDELQTRADNAEPVQRHTSTLETDWLAQLVAKHSDNYTAMARDRTLNPWQKTPGEIRRALNKARLTQ